MALCNIKTPSVLCRDDLIAKSAGGSYKDEKLQLLCGSCNRSLEHLLDRLMAERVRKHSMRTSRMYLR